MLRKINISIREVQRNRPFIYVGLYERRRPSSQSHPVSFSYSQKDPFAESRSLFNRRRPSKRWWNQCIECDAKIKRKNREDEKGGIDSHAPDVRLPPAGKFDLTPFSLYPSDVLRCLRNRAL